MRKPDPDTILSFTMVAVPVALVLGMGALIGLSTYVEKHSTIGCDGYQVVTKVEPVGHRTTTTYIMYGDQGGVMEVGQAVAIGSQQCFSPYKEYKGKRI